MDKLFLNKRTYIDKDGQELINMCIPSIKLSKINSNALIRLNSSHNGRIDKFVYECVSRDIDEGIDMTMYYNHIFNPFAISEDDVLYTPIIGANVYETSEEPSLPDGSHLSDSSSVTKQMTYAEKVEYYAKLGLGIS